LDNSDAADEYSDAAVDDDLNDNLDDDDDNDDDGDDDADDDDGTDDDDVFCCRLPRRFSSSSSFWIASATFLCETREDIVCKALESVSTM
jgi:hypothetical protein